MQHGSRCDYSHSRVYWFAELERALSEGDFGYAAQVAKRLKELGVEVRFPLMLEQSV